MAINKTTKKVVYLLVGIAALAIYVNLRGTPDSEVPYPDLTEAKTGKARAFENRPIPYHEIFLAWRNWDDLHLIIYNDLNKVITPEDWAALKANPDAIKQEFGCDQVVFNGPRFWVLDKIESAKHNPLGSIQGHEMLIPAYFTLSMKQMHSRQPYLPFAMNRNTKYTYKANDYLYKLVGPDGTEYVMQAASQEIIKDLQLEDLASLGARFKELPEGWSYKAEMIDAPFVNISDGNTTIVQDEFRNTYQIAN